MNRFTSLLAAGTMALGTVIVSTSLAPLAAVAVAADAAPLTDLGVFTGSGTAATAPATLAYDQTWRDAFLTRVHTTRAQYWDNNAAWDGTTTLRAAAEAAGFATRDAYVNGINWDSNLERSAIQRAFEQTFTGLSHNRPNGVYWLQSYETAMSEGPVNGVNNPIAENLADAKNTDPAKGLDSSYQGWVDNEAAAFVASKGAFITNTAHIYNFLNPANKAMGAAMVGSFIAWEAGGLTPQKSTVAVPTGTVTLTTGLEASDTLQVANLPQDVTKGSSGYAAVQAEPFANAPEKAPAVTLAGTFSSSDEEVIAIKSDGTWKATGTGTADITLTTPSGATTTETVTVKTGDPKVYGTAPATALTAFTNAELVGKGTPDGTGEQPGNNNNQQPGNNNNHQPPAGDANGFSLDPGAIAGIVIGILALLALIGIGANWQMIAPMLGM